ncbi:MAG: FIST C-terminal domain-containing protein [Oscillospiraceae bacterium]|jgi:hypothetical protein|nr:FIST C-terminal domain-containing protein [Oscillospiraceae bacterium]
MVKMMTAFTTEIDDVDDAVSEILSQLDLSALQKNSVGILTCHFEFIDSGLLGELHRRLPFDIIGMSTMASANPHGKDIYGLTLTVLTGDDVVFAAGSTGPLGADTFREQLAGTYNEAAAKLPGKPAMIISFMPFVRELMGPVLSRTLAEISGEIPVWGGIAFNANANYEDCYVIYNDTNLENALSMVLIYGEVQPEFVVVSIPEEHINKKKGVVTDSEGVILRQVNDMPVLDYLSSIGIVVIKEVSTTTSFMVYYEGSSNPVALGVADVNDDGSLLCGGEIPVGSRISIAAISPKSILDSAAEGLQRVLQYKDSHSGALMLPCGTRYVMSSPNNNDEVDFIAEVMAKNPGFEYSFGYSGGEICPVRDENGNYINRHHNYTFSACIL